MTSGRRTWRALLLGLLLAGLAATAFSQSEEPEAPAEEAAATETESEESVEAPDAAPEGEEQTADAAPQDEEDEDIQATMERFRPSEKISEDRSVAFPNDI